MSMSSSLGGSAGLRGKKVEGNEEWATGHCDFVTFTAFDGLGGLDIFDLCLGTIILPSLDGNLGLPSVCFYG